ncbi:MAG: hypothetical protein K2Q10_05250, partial [Rhodospirillales bacterium]|nr:hypothetical protein [Rhodospirillales bacterium]
RPQPSWSALCPSCNAFDSLVWGVPTTPVPPSMPATAMVGQSVAAPSPLPVESSPVPEGGPAVIAVESGGETRQTAS